MGRSLRATMSGMDDLEFAQPPLEPNPVTRAAYRRQVRLQVYLPLAVGIGIIAGAAALLWTGGLASASAWADASLVLLLLPVLLLSLIPIGVLAAFAYGVVYLMQRIPAPAHRVQRAVARVQQTIRRGSEATVRPFVVIRSGQAAAEATVSRLLSALRRGDRSDP